MLLMLFVWVGVAAGLAALLILLAAVVVVDIPTLGARVVALEAAALGLWLRGRAEALLQKTAGVMEDRAVQMAPILLVMMGTLAVFMAAVVVELMMIRPRLEVMVEAVVLE
jgi:hypothetical protein